MSYPTKYTRQYDYQGYQNANPNRPLPADKVTADLNAVAISDGAIVDFLKKSIRADGALQNGSVKRDTLDPSLQILLSAGDEAAVSAALDIVRNSMGVVNAYDYGVRGDGADYTVQGQAAIDAAMATGKKVVWPAGTIGTRGWTAVSASASFLSQGLQMEGAGADATIFSYVGTPGGYVLTLDNTSTGFQGWALLSRCTISGTGVSVRKLGYGRFEDVHFKNVVGNGIKYFGGGDSDGSFEMEFKNCRFDNCTSWGADMRPVGSSTELSNLSFDKCSFQSCGTLANDAIPPVNGSVAYRGIIAAFTDCGFTESAGPCIYVATPGTAQCLSLRGCDFENTRSTLVSSIYCDTALRGLHVENVQFLQGNAPLVCRGGMWFTSSLTGVTFAGGITFRIGTDNNSYVGFRATGPAINLDAAPHAWWQAFDAAGQQRFSGFTFGQIVGQCKFTISALNTARLDSVGYGFTMPMYYGGIVGAGEWIAYQVPSAGLSLALTAPLTPATQYYFYVYNQGLATDGYPTGKLAQATTTAPAVSATGGYYVNSGDPSLTYIGTATTDGSGNFQAAGTQASWYPPSGSGGIANLTGLVTSVGNATGLALGQITNSLSADVLLNNTAIYIDGPSIAQGSTGTWWASGTVAISGTGGDQYLIRLWDGTNVVSSAIAITANAAAISISLSGYLANPAGNLRISVRDVGSTSGKILFAASGNSKDSKISAFRIA